MKIIVGSTNPIKISAAKNAFLWYFEDLEVIGKEVKSGVSKMPFGDEIVQGAITRAKNAMEPDADFSVGLEGGVLDTERGMFLTGWATVLSRKGDIGLGNGGMFILPDNIAKRVRAGEELGPVMDEVTGISDIKKKIGAVGIFTRGIIKRGESFEHSIIYALTRFSSREKYR